MPFLGVETDPESHALITELLYRRTVGRGSQVRVILHHRPGSAGPSAHRSPEKVWSVSGLGLLRALRGQRRRHSCLVPQPLAPLSSRDASRSARRKRTGCVEPYDQGPPARPRYRRGPSTLKGQGHRRPQEYRSFERIEHFWAGMASGVPIFQWDRTFLGTEGRGGRRLIERLYQVD